jgi:penicillin-binding protein 2
MTGCCAAAPARCEVEVNAVGRVIRELDRQEGTRASDVALTLDLDLQKSSPNAWAGESASAVVMDVQRAR